MNNNKLIKSLNEEISIYEKFISHYNLEAQFENFIDIMDKLNQDSNGLYWYEFRLRPFSIGCQPKGHIQVIHDKGRWGIIAYDRPLTEEELFNYDLQPYNFA